MLLYKSLYMNINEIVHVLVWHYTVYTMGSRMVFSVALFCLFLTMIIGLNQESYM